MFGSNDNYHSKLFFIQSFLVKFNQILVPKNSDKKGEGVIILINKKVVSNA